MTKFKEKYEASDAFVQKRPAPKSKGWYSIVEKASWLPNQEKK